MNNGILHFYFKLIHFGKVTSIKLFTCYKIIIKVTLFFSQIPNAMYLGLKVTLIEQIYTFSTVHSIIFIR